jgi:UDP:flavonoid glycosyltransferase YjiC (YdhE family)
MPADPPILLAAIGSLGDLHPCLALALRERGHRAVIAATPEQEAAIGHQSGGRVFSSSTPTISGATTTPSAKKLSASPAIPAKNPAEP